MKSILLTTAQEAITVTKALDAIRKNRLEKSDEILIAVPDQETKKVIEVYAKKDQRIRIIQDAGTGKPDALNILLKEAKGDILILTDGDVFIEKNAFMHLMKELEKKEVGAVSGHPIALNDKNTMLGYWAHLLTEVGAHETRQQLIKSGKPIVCSGYLFALRNGLIKEIPGESLSDDAIITNLVRAKGMKIGYAPEARVYVYYPETLKDWLKQKRRSTAGYIQMRSLIKKKDQMRSFLKESGGIFRALRYGKNVKEYLWTAALIGIRLYLWLLIFYDIKIKQKGVKELWARVESTKNGFV